MKITAIIPCHNAAPWIVDAIRSIEAQTHQPKQIIIVDDSSTDDSIDRARSVGVELDILSVDRRNAAAARNDGIRAARGEWIAFLDADDEWLPDHLERASTLIQGADIAYLATSKVRYYENRAQIFDCVWPAPWPRIPRSGLDRWDFMNWFSVASCFCNCSVVASRQVLISVGGYDQSLRRRHDYELFLRLVLNGTWAFDPMPAAIVQRDSPGSISRNLVECDYYFLLGLLKNYESFRSAVMDVFLRSRARSALRHALTMGSTRELRETWKISRPLLSSKERIVYSMLRRVQGISRFLYALKDSMK